MKKLSSFTLIETIIAISIFCIWILTVLFGLSKTLRNQNYANTQIKSAFFAREWIELMFNLRDANYHKELPWNCIFQWSKYVDEDWCKERFEPWNILKISIWSEDEYVHAELWNLKNDFDEDFENYQIYFHTWNIINDQTWFVYNHTWSEEEKTWFARYLFISKVSHDGWEFDTNKLLKVESHVLYKKWELTWEKVMETFIWNYEF